MNYNSGRSYATSPLVHMKIKATLRNTFPHLCRWSTKLATRRVSCFTIGSFATGFQNCWPRQHGCNSNLDTTFISRIVGVKLLIQRLTASHGPFTTSSSVSIDTHSPLAESTAYLMAFLPEQSATYNVIVESALLNTAFSPSFPITSYRTHSDPGN